MVDIFIENPSLLKGQPKRIIGNYIENNGFPVPYRYDSLDEALESGHPFIARTEHTQDYNGASGIGTSPVISKEAIEKAKETHGENAEVINDWQNRFIETDKVIAKIENIDKAKFKQDLVTIFKPQFKRLCRFTEMNLQDFIDDFSFSFWQYYKGYNRTVVADTAIKERYHVFTSCLSDDSEAGFKFFHNYSIIDNGHVSLNYPMSLTEELKSGLDKLIQMYEGIRRLNIFNPDHCPIMEFQTVGDKHFFLQYHRARDFKKSEFEIKQPKDGMIQVPYVRGATSSDGMIVNASFYYPKFEIHDEEASFDFPRDNLFSEVMSRKRKVQFLDEDSESLAFYSIGQAHLSYSQLFKPELTLGVGRDGILKTEKVTKQRMESMKTKVVAKIPVYVISDGRTAYVQPKY